MKFNRLLLGLLLWTLSSCAEMESSEPPATGNPAYLVPELSPSIGVVTFPQPERNPMSKEGVLLGKMLFYDPMLSANAQVSCASCHDPTRAFSDGKSLNTEGVSGKPLHRNSPALFNLAWHSGWFWDGGAKDLESLNFGPITHPDEMDGDLIVIATYLASEEHYVSLFERIFPEDGISSATISRALAQYTRSLISQTSKFDAWKNGAENFTELELNGYQIYLNHCASCHQEGLFTDLKYHNNGLDQTYFDTPELEGVYLGRYRVSLDSADLGAYKTPSLRNITLTAPYMHDGRFGTLDEVLDHYSQGIQINSSLDPSLIGGIPLTTDERTALLEFIKTLQDDSFVHLHLQDKP